MARDHSPAPIRRPSVAGHFYPGDPASLREAIEHAFLGPLGPGEMPVVAHAYRRSLFGIVVPHAGYLYSAQGAAWGFAELARHGRPSAFVLLGINHRGTGARIALSHAVGWETPLGVMPISSEICEHLAELDPEVAFDDNAHALEHSLEVQVPFLQALFGEQYIIPILLGEISKNSIRRLGCTLARLQEYYVLGFIASTDFSHYISQHEAAVLDHLAMQQIAAVQSMGLLDVVAQRQISMCGVIPVACLLDAAKEAGCQTAKILHYHTSGDVTGEMHKVVGYGTVAVYRD